LFLKKIRKNYNKYLKLKRYYIFIYSYTMNLFTLFFGKLVLTKKIITIKKYGVGIHF